MRRTFVLVMGAMLAIALVQPASAGAEDRVYPPDAQVHGMSYEEWHGAYQVWLNEIPAPKNPTFHPDSSRNCELQAGGDVVFVGHFGSNCSIPEGVPVVFGTASWECSTAEGLGETFGELRRCARENFKVDFAPDVFHQRILIDGEPLKYVRRWASLTPGEIIDFPENNIWGAEPGRSKSVSKGFLFILRPLSEGTHRIVDKATIGTDELTVVWKFHVQED